MRQAWGLKLFRNVSSLKEARDETYTYVRNLINANLLMNGDASGFVKMHDLVRTFVLGEVSKGDHAWIINHGDVSNWKIDEKAESCKRLSLTCRDMSGFPTDLTYPNLSLLQLRQGHLFPEDFYKNMEKLEVIACYDMIYPSLLRSLHYSKNLKSLCLHKCRLDFDLSFVGDLVNLEVLNFAHCKISKLPSTVGNLIKLKLLDLSWIDDLRIDDGVFINLKNLEELYMTAKFVNPITQANFQELKMISSNLCALEVEFIEEIAQVKNMHFNKLQKFKISIGCSLEEEILEKEIFMFKNTLNTLKLNIDSTCELQDSEINELFKKTEKLYLEVEDMITLKNVSYNQHSFSSLRDLEIVKCAELKYLFPISVASGLRKLERLKISSCSVLEALAYNDESEISSAFEHSFSSLRDLVVSDCANLKYIFPIFVASGLRKLERLKISSCSVLEALVDKDGSKINSVFELPQLVKLKLVKLPNFISIYHYPNKNNKSVVLLNSEVRIPELKKLTIKSMEKLKHIWSSEIGSDEGVNNISMLRVVNCGSLENLFPTNPMPSFNNLEQLYVEYCDSLKEIFNIDLECIRKDVQLNSSNIKSRLKSIFVSYSESLTEVWRIKGGENNSSLLIGGFEAVESIQIEECKRFKNVFRPTNTKFDMGALKEIIINCIVLSEKTNGSDMSTIAFPSNLMHSFSNLHELQLGYWNGVEVVFDIESRTNLITPSPSSSLPPLLPNLQHLSFYGMERMSHVWNWSNFLVFQNQSSFRILTTIHMYKCNRIKYLFSPLMAKLLSNLKKIEIKECDGIEEIVSSRDDKNEDKYENDEITTSTNFFPHLQSLYFLGPKKLKRIGGGDNDMSTTQFFLVRAVSSSLCQNSREILLDQCESLMEVFETQGINNESGGDTTSTSIHERNGAIHIPRLKKWNVPQKFNLKKLVITCCKLLKHVFMFSTLESLRQLEELKIDNCRALEVIVKKENVQRKKVMEFSCLKTLNLVNLPNLTGFFLGINEFKWPLLENVTIRECPKIEVFTCGTSTTSKLKYIHTSLGKHSLEHGLNFRVTTLHQATLPSSSSQRSSLSSTTLKRLPFSFHNLIEVDMDNNFEVECIIPSKELRQLQKLERIRLSYCHNVKKVFEVEAMEGTNSESPTVIPIPNLTQLELDDLPDFEYIWNSNHHQSTTLEFPNLTTLSFKDLPLEHVFTSSMVGSLLQLKDLRISYCHNLQVIFKEEESGTQTEAEIPNLRQVGLKFPWIPLQFTRKSESQTDVHIPNVKQVKLKRHVGLKFPRIPLQFNTRKSESHIIVDIPNVKQVKLKFLWNLTTLSIDYCDKLEHVFTSSMIGSLEKLQHLHIGYCQNMKVVIKEEKEAYEHDAEVKRIVLPCLKSMNLSYLSSLKGFCFGMNHFSWPSLDTLKIKGCPEITVFTKGHLDTPALKVIHTKFAWCYVNGDLNSVITTKQQEGYEF